MEALHSLSQHVGTGVPISLAVGFVFKRVDVFFGHFILLLSLVGPWAVQGALSAKNAPPLPLQG
jgi:hypothetical protein